MVTERADLGAPIGPSRIARARTASFAAATEDLLARGWFDSSWDLQQGLQISEGLRSELPLDCCLQAYLRP